MEHFQNLLFNITLLILMGFAYVRIFRVFRQRQVIGQIFNGIVFGVIAIIVMLFAAKLMPGIIFDSRSTIISIAGLFGGPITAVVSILIASIYRIIQGGAGTLPGVMIIVWPGVIGVCFYYIRKKYPKIMKPLFVYLFGLLVSLVVILCIFTIPWDKAIQVFNIVYTSVIFIYPFVSFIIIYLLLDKESRIEAEDILAEREKQYSALLNNLSTGIIIHSPDSRITFTNPRASQLLGLTVDQMQGKAAIDLNWHFLMEDGSKMPESQYPVNQISSTLRPLTGYIVGVNRAKNDRVWVLVNAFPEFDKDMQLHQIVVSFTDITKNKQVQEALKESEEKLRITLNSIGDGVIVTDTKAMVTHMNPEAEKLTGWKLSDASGNPLHRVFDIINAKTLKTAENPVSRVIATGSIIGLANHTMLRAKNGARYQISDSGSPIKDKTGDITGVVLVFRDVTDEYLMQEQIQKNEILLNHVGEIVKVGGWEFDLVNNTLFWTDGTYKIHDTTPDKYTPTVETAMQFYTKESKVIIQKVFTEAINTGKEFNLDLEMITAKGRFITVHTSSKVIRKANKIVRVIGSFQDITKRKQAEQDIKDALTKAEDGNRTKSEFLATISHEIRTPLNGIIGFTGIMEDALRQSSESKERDKLLEYLNIVSSCGKSVNELINDILELASIEAGNSTVTIDKFSPEQLLKESIKIFGFKTKEKNIYLKLDHKNLPPMVIGGKRRLKQIIFNLVGNAIKFTHTDGVTVKADYKDGKLLIEVKDTGIGIPNDMQDKILKPFTQVDQSSTRKYSGSGLGLTIVSRILDNLNGTMNIESELNKGTTITVCFPVEVDSSYMQKKKTSKQNNKLNTESTVLVVEDSEISVLYLQEILNDTNINYKIAKSFKQIQEICNQGFIPNVVLMDISLPDADGSECVKWIRNKFPKENIKYVVQTAHVLREDFKNYKDTKFDDFLGKPYKKEELIDVIVRNL